MRIFSQTLLRSLCCSVILAAGGLDPIWGQSAEEDARRFVASPEGQKALTHVSATNDTLVSDIIALTQIPAPPFEEAVRGEAMRRRFSELGLVQVRVDSVGNVIGERPGRQENPLVVISAHLDTVFPEGTDTQVRREGTKLMAPGIGDDTRGLAVLLALIRALDHARIQTEGTLVFVATVGEEGLGDLRGVKYLFREGTLKDRIAAFVSIDGTDEARVAHRGIGSRRYRVSYKGPGGHSWGAFGLVSTSFALGRAMEKISRLEVPRNPRTSFNVGRIGGGTSINSIPFENWMEIDMRSESPEELQRTEKTILEFLRQAAEEENRARSTAAGEITYEAELVGDRPGGEVARDSDIVQKAMASAKILGIEPQLGSGSTDSNVPISMGLPAVTIGSGGQGGRAHALDEWIDVGPDNIRGVQRALVLAVLLAGF